MFGAPLEGDQPVRYVFIDEAGISANEPVRIVAGIIVHADKQCAPTEAAVNDALQLIPEHHRAACPVFTAKKIWGDETLRENWSLEDRKQLLCAMMSIPRRLNLPIALGACLRTTEMPPELLKSRGITLVQAQHGIAFQECVARADSWINKYARHNEVATVIAEDVPESKRLLRRMTKHLLAGYTIPQQDIQLTQPLPHPLLTLDEFRKRKISRIRLPIHFVEKQDEPLLQVADACAFGFRRFLSEQPHGLDFVEAILGARKSIADFPIEEWSGGIFANSSSGFTEKVSFLFG